ncbi:hypothetical protein [Deinococcus sp. QL22]|uniref:hypothetical protein n=1 Tax=Deinococcus sp. QL22 TaxID=2939437 RepID=UPI00201822E5|nr:hypothetical protein [Deinococcus sp. QL22]UQN08032.1 hypothetical protein M1R55_18240 [Deinococcus sp. QL22]
MIAEAIATKGYSVQPRGYAASLEDRTNTSSGKLETHSGFISLTHDVAQIYSTAIRGVSNPSKLVFVAHSHGVVWAHLFSMLYPQVPIEIQFDFDGVCADWQTDNQGDFERRNIGNITDFEAVCRTRALVFGGSSTDMHNITQPNVKYNVDLQSSDPTLRDSVDNKRPDGSTTGIYAKKFWDLHSGITHPGSDGLDYAVGLAASLTPFKVP